MQLSQDMGLAAIYQPIEEGLEKVRHDLLEHLRDAFGLIRGIGFEKTIVGGKQIRPALALLSGLTIDSRQGAMVTDIAVSSEMTHFASLIHDDIVDGAKTRRGSESVNARWHDKIAVLLGDYIISQALYLLSEYRNAGVVRTMMGAIKDMSEGELRQLTTSSNGTISEADYYTVIQYKTSSLMGAVCAMPAQALDEPEQACEAMNRFGHNFGMAFQIMDDLLDFTADEQHLGKPTFCDIKDGKATLPLICLLERLGPADVERIRRILRERRIEDNDKAWLLDAIRDSAADEYCIGTARDFAQQAKLAIEPFAESEYKKSMSDLCDYVIIRNR
jgi:geranylgeranyl pyrophosphate synthase